MNKVNYQIVMEDIIKENVKQDKVPTLLLHSCCAPCSSYCLELLSQYFKVTVFYYNPNIYPEEEYYMRVKEQQRFIKEFPAKNPISFIEGDYDTKRFYDMARGLEKVKEGGERCLKCYEMRLRESAEIAKEKSFDYFTTTLSISPMKKSAVLNQIGEKIQNEVGVSYLFSDFKKKNGYKRSTELSNEYNMYRQYYCGCVFSKRQRDEEIAAKEKAAMEIEN
ncbi:hypothetical protein SAMN04487761_1458 [Lachnospiraceae bacterium C7]|nr:hypothetical protein SAMN04487761_1458 [Lachnospiraceae bacterium C7]